MSHEPQEGKQPESAAGDAVRKRELDEIRDRRKVENIPQGDSGSDLVGVAFSGGGVRAGAFCLGVIQSLVKRKVLRFVDYLSTVSGGGYAGAYLSSAVLRSHQLRLSAARPAGDEDRAKGVYELPIAEEPDGRQSPRMLRFIFGGYYLRRTGRFLNRYLIGLFLIWVFVLSGLLAVASLVAWAFRNLDYIEYRTLLGALGFGGDVRLAFFPAFVLLILWLVAWAISFFRDRSLATGVVARYLLYALIIATATAIAALIGTGDIAVSQFLGFETVEIPNSVKIAIIGVIAGALLPYFSPRRLLESGTSPKNTAEKYIFFIATRGLLYGVPFLLIALFARENISGWNEDRDSRLTFQEIKKWSPSSPIWSQAFREPDNQEPGRIWKQPNSDLRKRLREFWDAQRRSRLFSIDFREYEKIRNRYGDIPTDGPLIPSYVELDKPFSNAELSFVESWCALLKWKVMPNSDEFDNPLEGLCRNTLRASNLKREISKYLNYELERENFYDTLLPNEIFRHGTTDQTGQDERSNTAVTYLQNDVWPLVQGLHTSDDKITGEKWAQELVFLREQAKELADAKEYEDSSTNASSGNTKVVSKAEVKAKLEERKEVKTQERQRNTLSINRRLLKAYYGDLIGDKSVVYSGTVLLKDQETRLSWFGWSLLVFLISGLSIDLNAASWHGFYRRRLGETWLEDVPGFGTQIPLAQLDTTAAGAPYQLISACLQLFGRQRVNEGGRRDHFLFSKLYCGSDRLGRNGYKATYSYMNGNYMLEDAVAISGAAVTPGQSQNPLVLTLFFLLNMRLGQWLENPAVVSEFSKHFGILRYAYFPFRLLGAAFWPAEERSACFVSDGGHFENLGIYPLLQRRCRLIIAFDVGQDGNFEFADFNRLTQRVRMIDGIRFECCSPQQADLSLDSLAPDEKRGCSRAHYVIGRIIYPEAGPDARPSWIVYAKSSLTGDEPQYMQRLGKTSQFPHDPTADQFYDATRFDAYRQLGQHIADNVLARLPESFESRSRNMSPGQFIRALAGAAAATVETDDTIHDHASADEELAKWVKTLEDPDADVFEHWFAAREIAKHHEVTDQALKSLIACLFSKEPHLAAVARRCLTEIGSPVLSILSLELAANTQPRLLKIIDVVAAIVQKTNEVDRETIDALAGRLKELSEKNRFEAVRIALVHVLSMVGDLLGKEFTEDPAFQTLQFVGVNDKSRSVRHFAERLLAEQKQRAKS